MVSRTREYNGTRVLRVHSLNESRFWPWKIASYYPRSFDAVFYPGMEKWDLLGLNLLRIRRGTRTVIATFEGVPGDMNREEFLTSKLGKTHKVFPTTRRSKMDPLLRFNYAHSIIYNRNKRTYAGHLQCIVSETNGGLTPWN